MYQPISTALSFSELRTFTGGRLILAAGHSESQNITGVSPVESAEIGTLSFIHHEQYEKYITSTKASLVLTNKEFERPACSQLVVDDAYAAFALVAGKFFRSSHSFSGVSDEAFVSPEAQIADSATVYPGAFIDRGVIIGERSVIYPGVFLGENVLIGDDTVIRPNVTIEFSCKVGDRCLIHNGCTIGGDGFGFTPHDGKILKIPQMGNVVIENDVEMGSGSNIDRATMGSTTIGEGSKLDAYLHVAHNVTVGKHNIICGGVGLAGSSSTADYVTLGGGVSVNNHVHISQGVRVAAESVVTKSIKEPGDYCGYPAVPMREWRRDIAGIRSIPKIKERLKKLEENGK